MVTLLLYICLLSQCQGSLQALHQPEIAQPGKKHLFPALLFLSHPVYPKLAPKRDSVLWCGTNCIYFQTLTTV